MTVFCLIRSKSIEQEIKLNMSCCIVWRVVRAQWLDAEGCIHCAGNPDDSVCLIWGKTNKECWLNKTATKEHRNNTLYYLYLSLCVWCVQVLSSLMPLSSTMFVLHKEHFDGSVLPLRHCTHVQPNLSQSQFTAHLIQVVHCVTSFPLCNVYFVSSEQLWCNWLP